MQGFKFGGYAWPAFVFGVAHDRADQLAGHSDSLIPGLGGDLPFSDLPCGFRCASFGVGCQDAVDLFRCEMLGHFASSVAHKSQPQ